MLSEGLALLVRPVRRGFPPGVHCSTDTSDFVTKEGINHLISVLLTFTWNTQVSARQCAQQPLHTLCGVAVGRQRLWGAWFWGMCWMGWGWSLFQASL